MVEGIIIRSCGGKKFLSRTGRWVRHGKRSKMAVRRAWVHDPRQILRTKIWPATLQVEVAKAVYDSKTDSTKVMTEAWVPFPSFQFLAAIESMD